MHLQVLLDQVLVPDDVNARPESFSDLGDVISLLDRHLGAPDLEPVSDHRDGAAGHVRGRLLGNRLAEEIAENILNYL
jgi:hypothetical protein